MGARARLAAGGLALALFALPGVTRGAAATPGVGSLEQQLEAATVAAEQAAEPLYAAAVRHGNLREELRQLSVRAADTKTALSNRVRQLYIYGQPDPISQLFAGLAAPDFAALHIGYASDAGADTAMLDDIADGQRRIVELTRQQDTLRRELMPIAQQAYAAQDKARALLEAAIARNKEVFTSGSLADYLARLNSVSGAVTLAVAPVVTVRGKRAWAAEEPIISEIERYAPNIPPGYKKTGVTLSGQASWYGPGFVGSPTASGSPYDPERLTAAMLAVPLGTVVRVTASNGRAVNMLINDRGPFKKGRILDLSQAGRRWLNFWGVIDVTVEVLERA